MHKNTDHSSQFNNEYFNICNWKHENNGDHWSATLIPGPTDGNEIFMCTYEENRTATASILQAENNLQPWRLISFKPTLTVLQVLSRYGKS